MGRIRAVWSMHRCVYPMCTIALRKLVGTSLSWHQFPEKGRQRDRWIAAIRTQLKDSAWMPHDGISKICGRHFEKKDVVLRERKRHLNRWAVPVIDQTCKTVEPEEVGMNCNNFPEVQFNNMKLNDDIVQHLRKLESEASTGEGGQNEGLLLCEICQVEIPPKAFKMVVNEEKVTVLLQSLLVEIPVEEGQEGKRRELRVCRDCATCVSSLVDCFQRLETLRTQFTKLRKQVGIKVVKDGLKVSNETWDGWMAKVNSVEDVFPSCAFKRLKSLRDFGCGTNDARESGVQTFGTKTTASRLALNTDIQCNQRRPRKDNLQCVNQPPVEWAHVDGIFSPESLDFSVDAPTEDPLALPTLSSSVNETPSSDVPIMMLSSGSKRTSSHLQKNPGNSNKLVILDNFKIVQPDSSSASGITRQTQDSNDLNMKVIKPGKKLKHRMNSLEDKMKSKASLCHLCGDTFPKTFLLQQHVNIAHDGNIGNSNP